LIAAAPERGRCGQKKMKEKKIRQEKIKEKKICFIASSGGHFEQLLMLRPLMDKYACCIVTEAAGYREPVGGKKMYYLKQVNRRDKLVYLWLLVNAFKSLRILAVEKPDVVVTTGALAVIPMCLLAKLFGKKLVFIESFAKVTSPTLTGKLLYKYADRFYVQWEPMKEFYPDAVFLGGLY